ncbi:hypothetical protein ACLRGF_00130 [Mycetocola zhadangensis]|uniref:hypothetical protein n=1 Tax=Mycetocola zhadangensis TaxID=1164595 RepID=UPI003A4D3094
MTDVDLTDDSTWRWVLSQYRFDPERNERRYVPIAVFDNEADFDRAFSAYAERTQSKTADGKPSPAESGPITGKVMKPGYLAEQARGHNVRRAIEHGADPTPFLADGPLPHNISVLTMRENDGSEAEQRG